MPDLEVVSGHLRHVQPPHALLDYCLNFAIDHDLDLDLDLLDDGEVKVAYDALAVAAHQDVLRLEVAVRDAGLALHQTSFF